MKKILTYRWHWLLPVLAVFIATTVFGQSIIYVPAPIANPGDPYLPWNSFGTQVGLGFPIVVNGQTVLNLTALPNNYFNPTVVQPSTTSAVIGGQPDWMDPENVWALPLAYGTEIGSNLANGGWFGNNSEGGLLITEFADSHLMEDPFLYNGWFSKTDPANTYLGFSFQEGGDTYYGWVQMGSPLPGAVWIYSYAYSTIPDMPIFAGEVPEPTTLVLLCMGGLALGFLRRHHGG